MTQIFLENYSDISEDAKGQNWVLLMRNNFSNHSFNGNTLPQEGVGTRDLAKKGSLELRQIFLYKQKYSYLTKNESRREIKRMT